MNESSIKIAPILKRVLASIIDHVILSIFNYPIALLLSETTIIPFSINMAISCYYYTYFLSTKDQASIGQKILKIHTKRCDNKKISTSLAFDRTLSEFLCPTIFMISIQIINMNIENNLIISLTFLITIFALILSVYWYAIALFSNKNQTLHDIIFNTIVVENE